MNAKQRRTWYRALRSTMQLIVLNARLGGTEMLSGSGYAAGALGDWSGWNRDSELRLMPRWKLTSIALRRQRERGMVWNVKR